uniref:Uncharacterized protein n=1 Tax=Enterococcus faecium TaxID=1352 RepID=A0A0D5MB61_ENTFC|nr:hypothetical protein pEfm12493_085 [Enterococcus faecium]
MFLLRMNEQRFSKTNNGVNASIIILNIYVSSEVFSMAMTKSNNLLQKRPNKSLQKLYGKCTKKEE